MLRFKARCPRSPVWEQGRKSARVSLTGRADDDDREVSQTQNGRGVVGLSRETSAFGACDEVRHWAVTGGVSAEIGG
jgi:hypothetical protein